jgi:hypothetical protein
MKNGETAVATVAETQLISLPNETIKLAIEKGADLDKLEKLLTLQERYEANQAKKIYNAEMVTVQHEMPTVAKSLKNDQTHSSYASLEDIINKTREIYTARGFSISFYEGITDKQEQIRICADVVHASGHKETYWYDVPLDGMGLRGNSNMTKIHAKASSTSYARRYLMCMIWNIPTGDDDGNSTVETELINAEEINNIEDLLVESESDVNKFFAYMKVDSVHSIPKSKYRVAVAALEAKLKAKVVK